MPVLDALWRLIKRDYFPVNIPAVAQCYGVINYAAEVIISVGLSEDICEVPGDFANAILNVQACTSRFSSGNRTYNSITTGDLHDALVSCDRSHDFFKNLSEFLTSAGQDAIKSVRAEAASKETSLSCYSYLSDGSVPPESLTCSNYLSTTAASGSAKLTDSIIPVDSIVVTDSSAASSDILSDTPSITSSTASILDSTSKATSSSTVGASTVDDGLSKSAIAGVAVGATIGGILVLALVIWFIWRHRRKHKVGETGATAVRNKHHEAGEKAQLHSDDYKPVRIELQESKAIFPVRTIEGVHEVEDQDLARVRSEMSANEVAAAELDRLGSSRVGTDSTLMDPDVQPGQTGR